jgi:hypothetical protein
MVAQTTTGQVATGGAAGVGTSVFGWHNLLAAAIGAALVFLLRLGEARQRSGLARLLNAEILRNSLALRGYDPSKITLPNVVIPRIETRPREAFNIQEFPRVKLEA